MAVIKEEPCRTMMEGLVAETGHFLAGNVSAFDGDTLIHAGTSAAIAAPHKRSVCARSSEAFVEFMLETVRDSLVPFANPKNEREIVKMQALVDCRENPEGNISTLSEELGCSKRSAELMSPSSRVRACW